MSDHPVSPTRYVRVHAHDAEGKRFQRTLQLTADTAKLLIGVEVNRFGSERAPAGVDERVHIIDQELIDRVVELRMSLRYGHLVELDAHGVPVEE